MKEQSVIYVFKVVLTVVKTKAQPSSERPTTLLEEAKIALIVDNSAETKVVVNDNAGFSDADLFRSQLGLRHPLGEGDSSLEISHSPFELTGNSFHLH